MRPRSPCSSSSRAGEPDVILVRTKQAILKEVAIYLREALDHRGLLCGGATRDYVIFPPSAIYEGPVLPSSQAKTAGGGHIGAADGDRENTRRARDYAGDSSERANIIISVADRRSLLDTFVDMERGPYT